MKSWSLLLTGLCGGGAIASAAFFAAHATPAGESRSSASASEVATLRAELDQLRKEHAELQNFTASLKPAVASTEARQAVSAPAAVKPTEANAAPAVSSVDRDAVFALIKEEREIRENERQQKQREQIRTGVESRIKQSAERVGLDANAAQSLVKLYLDNLDRESEIRKAYPVQGFNDPNSEKRRLELDAARKQLDAAVAGLVPADKKQEWDRSTRAVRRSGDFVGMTEGDGGLGGILRGLRENRDGGPGGGPGGGQNGQNRRSNRQGNSAGAAVEPKADSVPKKDGN
jgi:hypothetical protein